MDYQFDLLAKAAAGSLSRREALRRIGTGFGLSILAFIGVGARDPSNCANCCAVACHNLDPPPRGHEIAECIQHCHDTGVAIGPPPESGEPPFESRQCVEICADR
jgi:hypothetical protein